MFYIYFICCVGVDVDVYFHLHIMDNLFNINVVLICFVFDIVEYAVFIKYYLISIIFLFFGGVVIDNRLYIP